MKNKGKTGMAKAAIIGTMGIMLVLTVSMQVSYALNAGSPTPVSAAEVIPAGSLAPSNFLQVVDGMPNTDVEILAMGSGVKQTVPLGNSTPVLGGSLFGGNWTTASTQRIPEFADYEALAIQFNGSDPTESDYATDPDSGWSTEDLSLETTNLWLKVKYTNAGFYKGEMIDAVATIKVTPYKNRTVGASWASFNYSDKVYYPMIQLSELLYNGWSWQNVGEYNVDLAFYKKGDAAPIVFPNTSYYDTSGVYYTLNSLNPAKTFPEGTVTTLTGPEYVWPKNGTTSHAYIAANSNIQLDYSGDTDGVQYGYNGGINQWGGPWNPDQDKPTSPDWNMNSVMFTTSNTSSINFTLGLMERDPFDSNHVKRTSYMWASFSTDSFASNSITYIDIPVSKVWTDQRTNHPDSVTVDLYQEWTTGNWSDTQNIQAEKVQTVVLGGSNNWRSTFKYLPSVADLAEKLGVEADQVRYAAKEIEVPGYTATYTYQDDGSIVVNNKEVKPVATAGIDIEKKVTGNPETTETFTFELKPDQDAFPMPEGSDGNKEVSISGQGTASFGTWTYTIAGVYTYKVKEVEGTNADYIYDGTVYTINDTVTMNDSGDLAVTRTVKTTNGATVEGALTFNNRYKPLEEYPNSEEPTTPKEDFPITPESDTPVSTGDTSQTSLFFLLATMSLTVLTLLAYTSSRNVNKQH